MNDLAIKMEKMKAIRNGLGIQHILNEAYLILENPILLHDMEYKTIAYTVNPVKDDPLWNEFEATGTVNLEWLNFYKAESFLDIAASAKKITLLISEKLKYDRIFGKLFTKNNIQIGAMCMVECCKTFEDYDHLLFEAACDMLNKEFALSDHFYNYGLTYAETLMKMLIDGSIQDKLLYTAHVESINIGLHKNLFLAVIDISRCNSILKSTDYFKDMFRQLRPNWKYLTYDGYIVALFGTKTKNFNSERDLRLIHNFFESNNIFAGISESFDNLFELSKYYGQAKDSLESGMKTNENQNIFMFE